jgi:hypothetical protein
MDWLTAGVHEASLAAANLSYHSSAQNSLSLAHGSPHGAPLASEARQSATLGNTLPTTLPGFSSVGHAPGGSRGPQSHPPDASYPEASSADCLSHSLLGQHELLARGKLSEWLMALLASDAAAAAPVDVLDCLWNVVLPVAISMDGQASTAAQTPSKQCEGSAHLEGVQALLAKREAYLSQDPPDPPTPAMPPAFRGVDPKNLLVCKDGPSMPHLGEFISITSPSHASHHAPITFSATLLPSAPQPAQPLQQLTPSQLKPLAQVLTSVPTSSGTFLKRCAMPALSNTTQLAAFTAGSGGQVGTGEYTKGRKRLKGSSPQALGHAALSPARPLARNSQPRVLRQTAGAVTRVLAQQLDKESVASGPGSRDQEDQKDLSKRPMQLPLRPANTQAQAGWSTAKRHKARPVKHRRPPPAPSANFPAAKQRWPSPLNPSASHQRTDHSVATTSATLHGIVVTGGPQTEQPQTVRQLLLSAAHTDDDVKVQLSSASIEFASGTVLACPPCLPLAHCQAAI